MMSNAVLGAQASRAHATAQRSRRSKVSRNSRSQTFGAQAVRRRVSFVLFQSRFTVERPLAKIANIGIRTCVVLMQIQGMFSKESSVARSTAVSGRVCVVLVVVQSMEAAKEHCRRL